MRTLPKILGACAIVALAGSAAWAASASVQHRLTVWLPGGGSEVITYAGDIAPKVSFSPAPASFWSPQSLDAMTFDNAMPIDRMAGAIDADMASMIRAADQMMAMPMVVPAFNGMTEADLNAMPPGSQSYSVVSTRNGNNVCTQSVQITESGHGKPHVVRHSSGNCAGAASNSVAGNSVMSGLAPSHQDRHLTTIKSTMPQFVPGYPHI